MQYTNIIDDVINDISLRYNVTIEQLKGRSRKAFISKARVHAFIILRHHHGLKYRYIADAFNRKTSNVVSLVKTHEKDYKNALGSPFTSKTNTNNDNSEIVSFLLNKKAEIEQELLNLDITIKYIRMFNNQK